MAFMLDRKPNVAFRCHFVDEFENRSPLEQLVAYLVFDEGQEMKKLSVMNLRVAQNVP